MWKLLKKSNFHEGDWFITFLESKFGLPEFL